MMRSKLLVHLWLARLVRYLIVPAAFCAILFPLYGILHRQTEHAQLADASDHLSAAATTFEGYLSDLRFTTNHLFNDEVFTLLAASDTEEPMGDYMTPYEASSILLDLTYTTSYVDYSFVTFARNDYVVDAWRFFKSRDSFYPGALEYTDADRAQWEAWQDTRETLCLPVQPVALNRTTYPGEYLTVIQPYRTSGGHLRGAYTILLRKKRLCTLFLPLEKWREDGTFLLLQDSGEVLLQYNYEGDGHEFTRQDVGVAQYDGEKHLYVSRRIPSLHVTAVIALPYSVYGENLHTVIRAIRLYIGAGLAGCLLLSMLMTLLDLRRLRPLLLTLEEEGVASSRLFNEVILQKLYRHGELVTELERVRGELEHSRMEATLTTGTAGTPEEQKELSGLLGLTACNYLLLLPPHSESELADTGAELYLVMLREQVRQCYGRPQFVYRTTGGSILVILTLTQDSQEAQVEMCRRTEALYTRLELSEPLVLSGRFASLEDLSSVYWQARNSQLHADPTQKICYLSEAGFVRAETPDIVDLERLNGYLLSGSLTEAQALIRACFRDEQLSPQNFQQAFFSVRGVLLDAARKAGSGDVGYLCTYDGRRPVREQVQKLCDCCFEVCSSVELLRRSHNETLQKKILAWLDAHYMQPDLNIAMTAAQFSISRKYVSQFLKDQTGKSFTEYVEALRLTHAMELLCGTECGITEIALQCGFSTQNTFYKAFRRRYGVSPSAVRHGGSAQTPRT